MKTEQFNNHVKSINKLAELIKLVVMTLMTVAWNFLSEDKESVVYLLVSLFIVYAIISIQAINLKQKAIIRYMTDSIGDNQ